MSANLVAMVESFSCWKLADVTPNAEGWKRGDDVERDSKRRAMSVSGV